MSEKDFLRILVQNGNCLTPEALTEHLNIELREVRRLAYSLEEKKQIKIVSEDGTHKYRIINNGYPISSDLITQLKNRLELERNPLFSCSKHKYSYEEAMDVDFRCPKCNLPLVPYDNTPTIAAIEEAIHIYNGKSKINLKNKEG